MIKLINNGIFASHEKILETTPDNLSAKNAKENSLTYSILRSHSISCDSGYMKIKFDKLISHDITYVGIIQTARASGLKEFPVSYTLTNCHNSLCAVGGTINEDDHLFGLSAAKHYGGNYVPANQAVIHQYAREELCSCGEMILGSDSHTRYGAYGTMGVGEGGPELVKQLLGTGWDIKEPEVILVWLEGKPTHGVGPHDVALALCKAVFANKFVNNKILEFAGPGVRSLSAEFRMGIDVMTTETSCLSSIWETDETIKGYYEKLGRADDFKELKIKDTAYYDGAVIIDLSEIEPMIALPFHPSLAYTIREFKENAADILNETEKNCLSSLAGKKAPNLLSHLKNGEFFVQQGIIAGCAGGMFETITEASVILECGNIGAGAFGLSVYPASIPIQLALQTNGTLNRLLCAGAVVKPCFCGPCFGAGDTPANDTVSIRHTTRNFANREGSKPDQGQISSVVLMDGRSIAATAANGGKLTSAAETEYEQPKFEYIHDSSSYHKRCYYGFGNAQKDEPLVFGPNIADWPKMSQLSDNLLIKLCAVIQDDVTTTDELIPSGETSSYRSNPGKLAEFALSRRVPEYVPRSKEVRKAEQERQNGKISDEITEALEKITGATGNELKELAEKTGFGSAIFAKRPGDGSAREQAASCQKVLGGAANICYEFATKRYRSNCINWGILPFTTDKNLPFTFEEGDLIFIEDIRNKLEMNESSFNAKVLCKNGISDITLFINNLNEKEKQILLDGCLINYYAAGRK